MSSTSAASFVPSFKGKPLEPFATLTEVIMQRSAPFATLEPEWSLDTVQKLVSNVVGAEKPMWECVWMLWRLRHCKSSSVKEDEQTWIAIWRQHVVAWLVSPQTQRRNPQRFY